MKALVQDIYPLSATQRGMLFHTLHAPEAGLYFQQVVCVLDGLLDVDAFGRAWQALVRRHAIFRTSLVWEGVDQPLQVVSGDVALEIDVLDWRRLSDDEHEAR